MNCPLCGDICRCSPEPDFAAAARWMPEAGGDSESVALLASSQAAMAETRFVDPEAPDLSEQRFVASLEDDTEEATTEEISLAECDLAQQSSHSEESQGTTGVSNPTETAAPPQALEDDSAWREEVSARLSHYRARRKARPPRYPSLRLPFEEVPRGRGESGSLSSQSPLQTSSSPPAFETASNHALALDWPETASSVPTEASHTCAEPVPGFALATAPLSPAPSQPTTYGSAKIIEFPRSPEMAPPRPCDELAGPVIDRPRILEVPEVAPPPPALGGITMEAVQRQEVEKRPGIDIPLQSVPLARRLMATAIDGVIIAAASALFGFIFWKIAAVRPPRFQILGLAAGIPSLLWATYQYLLIVYSGSTPGLRLSGLEINRFDGTLTNRRLRRWRVLASYLSAVSLGMGYAWVLLDEESLCWHDRITHTYLAPRKRETPAAKRSDSREPSGQH